MIFDEEFYNGGAGYPKYSEFSHFKTRAEWLSKNFPDEKIIVIGCAYGYLLNYLTNAVGIDKSDYAYKQRVNDRVFLADASKYDYSDFTLVVSYNVLDCMTEEEVKSFLSLSSKLKHYHVLCFYDDDKMAEEYKTYGYFIKDRTYWFDLFSTIEQDVYLVEFATGYVWFKAAGEKEFTNTSLKSPITETKVSD